MNTQQDLREAINGAIKLIDGFDSPELKRSNQTIMFDIGDRATLRFGVFCEIPVLIRGVHQYNHTHKYDLGLFIPTEPGTYRETRIYNVEAEYVMPAIRAKRDENEQSLEHGMQDFARNIHKGLPKQ